MVLLIIIPFLNGYFIGNIPYFQTNPYIAIALQKKWYWAYTIRSHPPGLPEMILIRIAGWSLCLPQQTIFCRKSIAMVMISSTSTLVACWKPPDPKINPFFKILTQKKRERERENRCSPWGFTWVYMDLLSFGVG